MDDVLQDQAEHHELLERVERILSDRWDGPVRLGEVTQLSERRARNMVLRCKLSGAPDGAPPSVILKRARQRNYDPDDPKSRPAVGLFRDWAGLQFLGSLGDQNLACAEWYGGDRESGFFLMEDLRHTVDLDHLLTRSSESEAMDGLKLLASSLGRMHAQTIGRESEYQSIRGVLGPGDTAHRHRLAQHAREAGPYFAERCEWLKVDLVPGVDRDIERIASAMAEPGDFLAFTHCDACPDNCRITEDRLYLIDFEFASFRHALLDGVYGWIRFPTCWCVRDLPESAVQAMESAYRRELAKGCPAAEDDTVYFRAVAEACGYWLLENMAQLFDRAVEYETPKGTSTNRQRLMVRMAAFCHVAQRAEHLMALQETFARMLDRLRQLWRDDMSLYDAFGQAMPVTSEQVSAMVAAVQSGDVARVRDLLDKNRGLSNAKALDDDQSPILRLAIESRNVELIKLLLDSGADWRVTTRSGWTTLARACSHGTPRIVDLLLEKGADLNRRDSWGLLPIYGAVSSGNAEMLKHLLSRGAQPDLKLAIDLRQPALAKRLVEQDPSQARLRFGTGVTLLHDSARVGDSRIDAMSLLLAHGGSVNATTNWGATPLHLAAFFGHEQTIRWLLGHGADPNAEDKRGRTPKMLAHGRGHKRCARLLGYDSEGQTDCTLGSGDHLNAFDDLFADLGGTRDGEPHPMDDLQSEFGKWLGERSSGRPT
ncbi:Ankyrin repeats (3 copies) [Stieleria neptunia]|uniref:Ankyrin repeats (3 copies) n=1 Tax=Stieleria neptunia TaxID=2527979 RepID=A0A518HQ37_9BACT|nr:Ankyrin repeats (3 copies) [Stieleria neptunia]